MVWAPPPFAPLSAPGLLTRAVCHSLRSPAGRVSCGRLPVQHGSQGPQECQGLQGVLGRADGMRPELVPVRVSETMPSEVGEEW